MALLVLPIVSLVLYLIGFFSPVLVIYMAVAGLITAVVSYKRCARIAGDSVSNFSKYFSMVLIVVGVVLILCIVLSVFAIGPMLSSII
jgi:uncharacterized membrane protein